ncbi:2-hydroxyacid dehydrogenase [Devosia pacifica]|uniref:2-hydroxyacid dehydrogenase n=1 Tax=Devosia pacifica TaxID=1335967 RepID=A0A918S0V0_9HYPH|nr:D-2-hydroxyacid dehydrogenase [Devosia pacifica]GHA16260.1 2-hydroxyacid dehydrogenase [Devosia pacifica]
MAENGASLTIFVNGNMNAAREDRLAEIAPGADIRVFEHKADLEANIADADIVAGEVSEAAFANATRLKWVQSWAAGPDPQLYQSFVESDVVLTCCKGNGAVPLAEHAIMLMLMLNRDAMRWIDAQAKRNWDPFQHGELNGMTVGIIGAGYSGADLALKCKAFHMNVLGLRRTDKPSPNFDRMYTHAELHTFLAACDFVVMTAPYTPETANMLAEAEFRAMKPSAFYICFSRGGIANDDALYRAVDEGWIAGAGLDAHGTEPLEPENRFWTLRNTIVTPHNGASSAGTRERGFQIFAENLRRYIAEEDLFNVVDKRAGY